VKLIVGLGNPGLRYAGTRHNAGRHLVEFIAKCEGLKWTRKKSLKALISQTRWKSEEMMLARPEVFMNLSGEAVSLLAAHTGVDLARDILIIMDDVALPFGRLRLRGKGSDGGHNGLKSIHQSLGTTQYPRLRIGIAPESSDKIKDLTAYVLEAFDPAQKKVWPSVLQKSFEACRLWAAGTLEAAMNTVNSNES